MDTARHARGGEGGSVWTRSRSIEQRSSAKLENTSLSTDVFIRSLHEQLPSPGCISAWDVLMPDSRHSKLKDMPGALMGNKKCVRVIQYTAISMYSVYSVGNEKFM